MQIANLFGAASGGFNWYGFLIGSGMVVCIVIAYFMGKKRGYYKDIVFDIAIVCIPLAIVGARLYYVIFDIIGGGGSWTFLEIIGFGSNGLAGLAIYGGLIGAAIGGMIVAIWKKYKPGEQRVTFLQMCDLCFTVIILGQAIGRWGNFANQEAYGNVVTNPSLQWFPYAVFIDAEGAYFQATFFYEFLLNIAGFCLLFWLYNGKRKSFDGFILSMYCIVYGTGRFFIEGLRSDSLYLIPDVLRVSQLVSACLVLFGIGFIVAHFYIARTKQKKPFVCVDQSLLCDDYLGYSTCVLAHPIVYEKKKKFSFFSGENVDEVAEAEDNTLSTDEEKPLNEGEDGESTAQKNEAIGDSAQLKKPDEPINSENKEESNEQITKKKNRKEVEDFDADLNSGYNGEDFDDLAVSSGADESNSSKLDKKN